MATLRTVLIGCGPRACTHLLPHLCALEPVELIAVCDPDEKRAGPVARRFHVENVYTEFEDVLAQLEPQAVVLSGTPNWQEEVAARVLQIGRSALFIDSPAVQDPEAMEGLCAAQKQAAVQVQVGTSLRMAPAHQLARRIIQAESFGQPMLIDARYASVELGHSGLTTANRLERFLLHHAVSLIDFLCHLMGDLIRVDARTCWKEAALALGLTAEFANEAIGFVTMTSAAPAYELSVLVAGDAKTSIEIHQARHVRLQSPQQRQLLPAEYKEYLAAQQIEPGLIDVGRGVPGVREQLEAFVDNLLAERPLQPNLRQHRDVLRVVDAIRKSTKTGQPIRIRTTSFGAHRPTQASSPADAEAGTKGDGEVASKPRKTAPKNANAGRRARKSTDPMPLPPRTGRPAQTPLHAGPDD